LDAIVFRGVVVDGVGKHHKMRIPGRNELLSGPSEWPERLWPGSLNVSIAADGYPPEFAARSLPPQLTALDRGVFRLAFEIPHDQILANTFAPTPENPRHGRAQVWRADLAKRDSPVALDCWVLRRFGSKMHDRLELVAGCALRPLGFANGQPVSVTMFGEFAK
jgi:hypothetical protein